MARRPISIDELDELEVGEGDQLYWKSKPVMMQRKFSLEGWTLFAAIVGGVAALLSAVHPFGVSFGFWPPA